MEEEQEKTTNTLERLKKLRKKGTMEARRLKIAEGCRELATLLRRGIIRWRKSSLLLRLFQIW